VSDLAQALDFAGGGLEVCIAAVIIIIGISMAILHEHQLDTRAAFSRSTMVFWEGRLSHEEG
jgi:hypothetical protein